MQRHFRRQKALRTRTSAQRRVFAAACVGHLLMSGVNAQVMAADERQESREEALLRQLTLAEKVSLLSGATSFGTAALERLHIRSMQFTDGPYGVRSNDNDPATVFPVSLALAATWNPTLLEQVGKAIGEEARALGNHVLLGPNLNLVRSPLAGRNFETYGEDPWLIACLGTSFVRGVQSAGVGATPKHYVGNEQETERMRSSSNIDERTLQEIYLAPFAAVVRDARPWALMTAYNRVNGVYMAEHDRLLREVLKQQWGFDGVVMSDWGGTHSVNSVQAGLDLEMPGPSRHLGKHLIDAVQLYQVSAAAVDDAALRMLRLSVRTSAPSDATPKKVVMDTDTHRVLARKAAAEAITLLKNEGGLLPLDAAKVRSIAIIGPNADAAIIQGGGSAEVTPSQFVTPLQAIREIAPSGMNIVHAKGVDNDRHAPLLDPRYLSPTRERQQRGLTVAYYPNMNFSGAATETRVEERIGNLIFGSRVSERGGGAMSARWSGYFTPPATGSYQIVMEHLEKVTDSMFGAPDAQVVARVKLDGRALLGPEQAGAAGTMPFFPTASREATVDLVAGRAYPIVVEYASRGVSFNTFRLGLRAPGSSIEEAVQAARVADIALVFVGSSTTSEGEGRDRETLRLFGEQDTLVEAIVAANPRTVVVLNNGGPVAMPWLDRIPAVVEAWLPGQEGPRALADVLLGHVNPSGRLPVTFPRRVQDNPSFLHYPGGRDASYGEGVFVGYRYYDKKAIEPLFPFGFGLSYTKFEYSELRVPQTVRPGESFEISVQVKNIGERAGTEIAQLYVTDQHCSEPCPAQELRAAGRAELRPGESQTVRFELEPRALAHYDVHGGAWRAAPGSFQIAVGSSSRDLRVRAELHLTQ